MRQHDRPSMLSRYIRELAEKEPEDETLQETLVDILATLQDLPARLEHAMARALRATRAGGG